MGDDSVLTTSVYVFTFLFIGLPVWWKTTTVYRYPVPHTDCQNLLSETVKHTVSVKIVLEDENVQQGYFWEELLKLQNELQNDNFQPIISFQWSMSTASEKEGMLIKQFTSVSKLDKAFQLEDKQFHRNQFGELIIVILNKKFSNEPKFTLGTGRHGYILNNSDCKILAQDVIFLAKKMSQQERLQKLYTPASLYSGDKVIDKDKMRYLRASNSFDITFSLIVPEPNIINVNWDIETAIDEYLKDVLDQINKISTIKVKSQILYMTSLPIPVQQLSMNKQKEHILRSEHLPSLINPVEDKLGSDTSVYPKLNFVVYVPTSQQVPVRIYDYDNKPHSSNAFLLPQWGGFMFLNYPVPENVSLPYNMNVDMQVVMEVFLSQFRLLLGLPDIDSMTNDLVEELKGPVIRDWELDFLLRKNAQEQLSSSMTSLSSLSHLLQKIRNIVINDEVGQKIHFALDSTKESLKLLSEGNLEKGFEKSQEAFITADEAFFDPSLLALLYFPEDQKYAIYIPLFLPISVPVLTSVGHLWNRWKSRQEKLKAD